LRTFQRVISGEVVLARLRRIASTSLQSIGIETGAPARARTLNGATYVLPLPTCT
jgi:hypothetical protein